MVPELEAMCYLHTFDPMIIHRDLKSLNLLLGKKVLGPSDVPLAPRLSLPCQSQNRSKRLACDGLLSSTFEWFQR